MQTMILKVWLFKIFSEFNIIKLSEKIELIFQIFLSFSFHFFVFYSILFELINFKKDTSGLTNYGFGILLGLSAICFTWAKSLTEEDADLAHRISECAVDALYGTIIFLLGAGFKYFVLFINDIQFLSFLFNQFPKLIYIPKAFAFVCFMKATMCFGDVVLEILKIIALIKNLFLKRKLA